MSYLRNIVAFGLMDFLTKLLFCKGLLLIFITLVESEVEWYITSDPVRLGSDLELLCNTTQSSCKNCTALWNAGRDVLAFNDKVIDSSKYAVSRSEVGVTITIKGLTTDDIFRTYRCTYSFESFTKNLTLPVTFEYQPTNDTTNGSHSLKGKDLHLTYVFEEVHPKPVCSVRFDEEDLSAKLNITSRKKDIFLNVNYELNHKLRVDQSGGKLRLECSVGTITETYYDVYIGDDDAGPLPIIIGLFCGILVIIIIVCIMICQKRSRKHKLFDTCMDYNSQCNLCLLKNTSKHTDNKTDTYDCSISEMINELTTDVIISGDEDKKEPAGEESVLSEIKEGPSTPLLFHRSLSKEIPIINVNILSVSHDYTRSDSSGSSDARIDCLARDRHQNCNNTTESNQSQLSIALEENLLDRKKDHATLQVISENDVVQRDKVDSSVLNDNYEKYHLRCNSDLPQDLYVGLNP